MYNCFRCNNEIPNDAAYCPHCGEKQGGSRGADQPADPIGNYQAVYNLDFVDTARIPAQLRTYFLKSLRARLASEKVDSTFDSFVDLFHETSFRQQFAKEAERMAAHCYQLSAGNEKDKAYRIDQYVKEELDRLLDSFILTEGKDLYPFPLSEKARQYTGDQVPDAGLQQIILDYLDMEEEKETWYIDFTKMPVAKLKNALTSFLFPAPSEKILLICDQTVFGSCREGFAFTEKGLYWKAHFNEPQQIFYEDLYSIEKESDWLKINGHFFNCSPTLNVKMMYLLRKLRWSERNAQF